jgi:hypothetical protein
MSLEWTSAVRACACHYFTQELQTGRDLYLENPFYSRISHNPKTNDSERMTAAGFFRKLEFQAFRTTFLYHQNAKNENPRCVKLDSALRILVFQDFIII